MGKRKVMITRYRNQRGSLMTEFASAFVLFTCCLMIPLINISVIPVRYVISFAMVSEVTRKLALAETRSQAISLAAQPAFYQTFAKQFGIAMEPPTLSVVCKDQNSETVIFPDKKPIPPVWLPGGSRSSHCNYLLRTETTVQIPPLFCFGPKIPALTSPILFNIGATAPWENLGCDPNTREFYINE
jgi:hypothetical protein